MLAEFEKKVKKTNPEKLKQVPTVPEETKQPQTVSVPPASVAHAPASNLNNSPNNKQLSFFARLKKVKNFEIYVAVALILVMVAIYMTTFGGSASSGNSNTGSWKKNNEDYAKELETKLVSTLSAVKGAGNVKAMVTVVGSATLEIAYNIDEKTVTQSSSNGSATTTTTVIKTPVIINGSDGPQPVILLEIKPQLKGIVIVASGAGNISVRLQLLRAVQTLVADSTVLIEILTGN